MKIYKLFEFNKDIGAMETVGIRFIYANDEMDSYMEKLVREGVIEKGVAYDLEIENATHNGLIHALMCYPVGNIDVGVEGFKKGKRLYNDLLLQKHLAKVLDYDWLSYISAPKEYKSWLSAMALDKEFGVLRKPVKEQLRLYKIACTIMGSKRAKSVEILNGTKVKLKYFTRPELYAEAEKYITERGNSLSGVSVMPMLWYLGKVRGAVVVREHNLTQDVFAKWSENNSLVLKTKIKDENVPMCVGMLYK